jgi:hypothetical protein
MISLGAGIYEELVFRVLLVSGLAWLMSRVIRLRPTAAGVSAVIIGALIFSMFHYIGPYGDDLALASFTFRAVAGVLFSCPGTSFREAEVTIDGQPAGVAPVYPWLFTGAIDPLLWRPIPSVQTLNFLPYRVDLTPFAGVLSNGQPHQVGVSVYNANHYFTVAASLLLYLDHGASQVTGAVTRNTLGVVQPATIREDLATADDGTVSGTVSTTSERRFTIAGYVNTSHGRVQTTLRQTVSFSNQQRFLISAADYIQKIRQGTEIFSSVDTTGPHAVAHSDRHFSYPLALDYTFRDCLIHLVVVARKPAA